MKVYKFGGTSVGSAERMKQVAELINGDEPKIVVLSAVSGMTNQLVQLTEAYRIGDSKTVQEVVAGFRPRYDEIIEGLFGDSNFVEGAQAFVAEKYELLGSFETNNFGDEQEKTILAQGELISTNLMQMYLESINVNSALLPALSFMKTVDGEPDYDYITDQVNAVLSQHQDVQLFITQGYICLNENGEVDNLRRGGSDYSASIIGACVDADEVQIWTDIDGMHNNDPRFVEGTEPVEQLHFDEAAELAYFGAKILHPASVLPTKEKDIPVRLLNTMDPQAKGTTISSAITGEGVKSIAAKDGITAIKIRSSRMLFAYGFLKKVFEVFEKYKTPIDMITTSEVAVSLTIDDTTYLKQIVEELESLGHVEVDTDQTIVCIVGQFLQEESKVEGQIFNALQQLPVRMISYGGSSHNISVLLGAEHKVTALNLLHEELFLPVC
ncbi:aspartate kinase [Sediminitomix flava]|uniref:Aspartokinase n=1 Tax=Sediminitomix flava TaxID=379075 RepID=A0A315ZB92_SEDFL|nr:aspartate kinase [Sediminitomix flava]PWJ42845.1 aspartate kinase [Sediminitomix flava]